MAHGVADPLCEVVGGAGLLLVVEALQDDEHVVYPDSCEIFTCRFRKEVLFGMSIDISLLVCHPNYRVTHEVVP